MLPPAVANIINEVYDAAKDMLKYKLGALATSWGGITTPVGALTLETINKGNAILQQLINLIKVCRLVGRLLLN